MLTESTVPNVQRHMAYFASTDLHESALRVVPLFISVLLTAAQALGQAGVPLQHVLLCPLFLLCLLPLKQSSWVSSRIFSLLAQRRERRNSRASSAAVNLEFVTGWGGPPFFGTPNEPRKRLGPS
jgi:hypothetical protein